MKKIMFIALTLLALLINLKTLNALEEEIYFTNLNGVQLTKTEYDNLRKGFDESTINTMSEEMINNIKDDENIRKITTTKYVKTSTRYINGNAVSNSEEEISSVEYNNSPSNSIIAPTRSSSFVGNDYVETNYKKITLTVTYGGSVSSKYVTLTNVWKTIPAVKSFDVLAIAPGVAAMTFGLDGHRSGYQKWDGNIINYSANSDNWKTVNSNVLGSKGLGLSQNIVNDTTTSLENSITVVFLCGADPFPVRATYQHATSSVTLSQSQNYTIGTDGMGGVLKFSSSIWNKYDNTPGLYAVLSLLS